MRSACSAAGLALLCACGNLSNEDVAFMVAIPQKQQLHVALPQGAQSQSLCAIGAADVYASAKTTGVSINAGVDAILSLVDIDVLKRHADEAEWARDYAVSVVDAVLVPLVVLDEELHVISANESFYESFGGSRSDTESRSFFAVAGGEWDIAALRSGLRDLFTKRMPFQGLEVEGRFPRAGQRTMSFSARAAR